MSSCDDIKALSQPECLSLVSWKKRVQLGLGVSAWLMKLLKQWRQNVRAPTITCTLLEPADVDLFYNTSETFGQSWTLILKEQIQTFDRSHIFFISSKLLLVKCTALMVTDKESEEILWIKRLFFKRKKRKSQHASRTAEADYAILLIYWTFCDGSEKCLIDVPFVTVKAVAFYSCYFHNNPTIQWSSHSLWMDLFFFYDFLHTQQECFIAG